MENRQCEGQHLCVNQDTLIPESQAVQPCVPLSQYMAAASMRVSNRAYPLIEHCTVELWGILQTVAEYGSRMADYGRRMKLKVWSVSPERTSSQTIP